MQLFGLSQFGGCDEQLLGFLGLVFYTLLFGLVFGIGSSHYVPAPKVSCGYLYSNGSSEISGIRFCDQNAACTPNYPGPYWDCRCNAGYSGDGKSCTSA